MSRVSKNIYEELKNYYVKYRGQVEAVGRIHMEGHGRVKRSRVHVMKGQALSLWSRFVLLNGGSSKARRLQKLT